LNPIGAPKPRGLSPSPHRFSFSAENGSGRQSVRVQSGGSGVFDPLPLLICLALEILY
jgi:hypothetical protein